MMECWNNEVMEQHPFDKGRIVPIVPFSMIPLKMVPAAGVAPALAPF